MNKKCSTNKGFSDILVAFRKKGSEMTQLLLVGLAEAVFLLFSVLCCIFWHFACFVYLEFKKV